MTSSGHLGPVAGDQHAVAGRPSSEHPVETALSAIACVHGSRHRWRLCSPVRLRTQRLEDHDHKVGKALHGDQTSSVHATAASARQRAVRAPRRAAPAAHSHAARACPTASHTADAWARTTEAPAIQSRRRSISSASCAAAALAVARAQAACAAAFAARLASVARSVAATPTADAALHACTSARAAARAPSS
eukprot:CAMPEP_0206018666 /NCGR_PEP_ID=MMETSP1464-20131121/27581_1 /ASSEMBLY_ACC=CAM_ASM_001124 /TAXON_ID=119497 /ORGANISM="Exanthemachrysis gayraliae, Strain RCC1523" /LENGTH=191 /DNA_ID=CAMNT_0053392553 /DNA_START=32 /DNA_END=604 /DNA_ORIENTATION=-